MRRTLARASRPIRRAWARRGSARWRSGPPDFVGVGAQRCGTTWWWRLLCHHPLIRPAPAKELHYFDPFFRKRFDDEDVEAYHDLFRRPDGALSGEWTPRYMHDFWTPALLARAAPEARLLVLLRDPMARYLSGIRHEMGRLRRQVWRPRYREHVRAMIAADALSRSLYAAQLERLFRHFDRSRILILQYERCVSDPLAELRRTYEFIGLEMPEDLAPGFSQRLGRSHPPVATGDEAIAVAGAEIQRDAARLARLAPELDLGLWPSCRPSEPVVDRPELRAR